MSSTALLLYFSTVLLSRPKGVGPSEPGPSHGELARTRSRVRCDLGCCAGKSRGEVLIPEGLKRTTAPNQADLGRGGAGKTRGVATRGLDIQLHPDTRTG